MKFLMYFRVSFSRITYKTLTHTAGLLIVIEFIDQFVIK